MSAFLDQMREVSLQRASALSRAELMAKLADQEPPRPLSIEGFGLIAEVKRVSPAEGALSMEEDPVLAVSHRADEYSKAGAVAISVLTEPSRFGGDLSHLSAAVGVSCAPVMRKDFLVHPDQVLEAAAHGASGVLLIVRMVSESILVDQVALARDLGLFVLMEAFDVADLEAAQRLHPGLVGINCRDLQTLEVDPDRFAKLAPHLPRDAVAVAESGVKTTEDAARVAQLGFDLALVGSALMRVPEPGNLVAEMTQAGRRAQEEMTCASA